MVLQTDRASDNADAGKSDLAFRSQTVIVSSLFVLVTLALGLALLVHIFNADQVSGPVVASLVFGIIALPLLLALVPRFAELDSMSIAPTGVAFRLKAVEAKTTTIKETADEAFMNVVKFIFLAMPTTTYYNLVKICGDRQDPPVLFRHFDMTDGFRSQIRLLRDNGYINVKGYVGALPKGGDNLSQFVESTELGNEFVHLRKYYTASAAPTRKSLVGPTEKRAPNA